MKNFSFLAAALLLSACAAPLSSGELMPKAGLYDQLEKSKYSNAITLGNVDVKKGIGGIAPVDVAGYKEALLSSLRQANLYAKPEDAKYTLDSYLSDIEQPIIGFSFTVKTTAEYTLKSNSNGSVVYQDTLNLPCTTPFAEAWNADVRMRKATGCAVGENITHFLKTLSK